MADNEGTPDQTDRDAMSDDATRTAATDAAAVPASDEGTARTDLSVAELREWLRKWVADATGQPVDNITVDRPMEEFGLASRDALALGGDIEELTGVTLNVTVLYQHPTIASLAEVIVHGEPEPPEGSG